MFEIIKKFIAILVLSLLWCNTLFAEKVNLNKLKIKELGYSCKEIESQSLK